MKKQIGSLMSAQAVPLLIIAMSSVSHAATITNVTVTISGTTWCASGCANNIWAAGIGAGVLINPGQSLVLTQTAAFNFDTSEVTGGPASITVTQTGLPAGTFTDTSNVLVNFNNPDTGTNQEAREWTLATPVAANGLVLWTGYADTAHSDPFTDGQNGQPINGVPDNPWTNATVFIGAAGGVLGPSSCNRGIAPCFDAGAIRIGLIGARVRKK